MRNLDRPAPNKTAIQEERIKRGTTGRSNVDGKWWEAEYVKMRRILLDTSRCVCEYDITPKTGFSDTTPDSRL